MQKSLYSINIASNKTVKNKFPIVPKSIKINDAKIKVENPKIYTMEEAVEKVGFGKFQIKLIAITGFAYVNM